MIISSSQQTDTHTHLHAHTQYLTACKKSMRSRCAKPLLTPTLDELQNWCMFKVKWSEWTRALGVFSDNFSWRVHVSAELCPHVLRKGLNRPGVLENTCMHACLSLSWTEPPIMMVLRRIYSHDPWPESMSNSDLRCVCPCLKMMTVMTTLTAWRPLLSTHIKRAATTLSADYMVRVHKTTSAVLPIL